MSGLEFLPGSSASASATPRGSSRPLPTKCSRFAASTMVRLCIWKTPETCSWAIWRAGTTPWPSCWTSCPPRRRHRRTATASVCCSGRRCRRSRWTPRSAASGRSCGCGCDCCHSARPRSGGRSGPGCVCCRRCSTATTPGSVSPWPWIAYLHRRTPATPTWTTMTKTRPADSSGAACSGGALGPRPDGFVKAARWSWRSTGHASWAPWLLRCFR
mmetsp:Transcript_163611/g.524607  ORF Transcript_163611/g.524607 Transcript_163611/m.524607 type:complete len:215 (+) Transcript_163611:871-1515(+)